MIASRDGEIGRRSGLKIRRSERTVGVRFPLPAPTNPLTERQLGRTAAAELHGSGAPCLGSFTAIVPESCPNCFCDAAADFCWAAASAWSRCCFASRAVIASLMSRSETMAYLSNPLRVFQPPIFGMMPSATPARRRLRAAVLRRSWKSKPGTFAASQAVAHAPRKSRTGVPSSRVNTNADAVLQWMH